MVDVVILSYAKTPELKALTEQTVRTLLQSEKDIEFNPIVIESNPDAKYDFNIVYRNMRFNYNAFMNYGISLGNAEYVALCNNDLIFQPNWCSTLIRTMGDNYLSASPMCIQTAKEYRINLSKRVHFGYDVRKYVAGWCIFVKREIFDIIGKLDEDFEFWYADNAYAEQIKAKGIKHLFVTNSRVDHLGSRTLVTMENKDALTFEQESKFNNKYRAKNR